MSPAAAPLTSPIAPKLLPRPAKHLFSRWSAAAPGRVHLSAHSHHPWPDASYDAQVEAWNDAVRLADFKWEKIFEEVVPKAQQHAARVLHLRDASSVAFAPSTRELVMRAVSAIEGKGLAGGSPLRVLTTDSEFHSWVRQLGRLEEAGLAFVERVPVEPFGSFADRFIARLRGAPAPLDVIYTSHVFYNSGYVFERAEDMGKPAVVNLSLGSYSGSHDGQDAAALFIDSLVNAKRGRAVVCAGGNLNNYFPIHLRTVVDADTSFTWFTTNANTAPYNLFEYPNVFFEVGNELLSSDSAWYTAVTNHARSLTTKPVTQNDGGATSA